MSEYNSMKDIAVEFENCKEDLEYFQNKNELQEKEIHNLEDRVQEGRNKINQLKLKYEIDIKQKDIYIEKYHKEVFQYKKLVYDILLSLECDKEIRNLVNKGLFIEEGECIRPYCDEVGKYPIN